MIFYYFALYYILNVNALYKKSSEFYLFFGWKEGSLNLCDSLQNFKKKGKEKGPFLYYKIFGGDSVTKNISSSLFFVKALLNRALGTS